MNRNIRIYLPALFFLILGLISIQLKWFVRATLNEEELIHSRMNTALCSAFNKVIREESLETASNKCTNLGNGQFEFLTNSGLGNLDRVISRQLTKIDEINLPFRVTLASQANQYQAAYVNLDIPTRSELLIDRMTSDQALSFVFMFLIGIIFIDMVKILNKAQSVAYFANQHANPGTVYAIGRYTFDFKNQELTIDQQRTRITEKESRILRFLCDSKNQIVRKEEILTVLWGENDYFKGRSLDVFMARLRKYLSKDLNIRIENVYGVGFILHEE